MHSSLQTSERKPKSTRSKKLIKQKAQQYKENGFLLDCLNSEKSKLQTYNSINDKFLNYFVIRVHPNVHKGLKQVHSVSRINRIEHKEHLNHNRFQEMLSRQKARIHHLDQVCHSKPQSMRRSADDIQKLCHKAGTDRPLGDKFSQAIRYRPENEPIKEFTDEQEEQI